MPDSPDTPESIQIADIDQSVGHLGVNFDGLRRGGGHEGGRNGGKDLNELHGESERRRCAVMELVDCCVVRWMPSFMG